MSSPSHNRMHALSASGSMRERCGVARAAQDGQMPRRTLHRTQGTARRSTVTTRRLAQHGHTHPKSLQGVCKIEPKHLQAESAAARFA